jgi:DNA-binding transcriptional LysR family regulator
MSALCKTAGFKPRFSVVVDGITNVLSLVASENAVTLLPAYFQEFKHPGVIFVPTSDPRAKWDFIVLWQRGKVPASTHALVHGLKESAARFLPGKADARKEISLDQK